MIERTQTYVFRYDDATGTGFEFGQELRLDPDAPFRLTGIGIWNLVAGQGFANSVLNSLQLRFTRPDRMWVQRNMIPGNTLVPGDARGLNTSNGGLNYILWSPVSPNMVYPPSGTVQFDVQTQPNVGPISLLIVLFGTKLFRDGAVWSPTYPARWNALPFFGYGVQVNASALPINNLPMPIAPDADFAWQQQTYSDNGGAQAFLALGGEKQAHLLFTAVAPGTGGNAITIEIDRGGILTPLSITVIGTAIRIHLATDGGGLTTSTGQDVVNLVNATAAALLLVSISGSGLSQISPDTANVAVNLAGGTASTPNQLINLGVKFKDFDGKYYMNDFVPLGLLYGFGLPQVPGLVYPEIYIPKNQAIYFDFAWITSPAIVAAPAGNTATLTHKGMKVYS